MDISKASKQFRRIDSIDLFPFTKLFVVYVDCTNAGADEASQAFTALINDDRIHGKLQGDKFVAIKVESESEAYTQFAQICKFQQIIINCE